MHTARPDMKPTATITRARLLGIAASAAFLAACGGGGAATAPAGSGSAVFTTLDLAPVNPALPVGASLNLTVTARDQDGQPISGLGTPSFASSATGIASVSASGLVTGIAPGTATITGTLTSGGVTHSGSAVVTVSASASGGITITTPGTTFSPQSVTIAVGDTVTWQFSGATHNVTFNGAAPPGGNIQDMSPGSAASRVFTSAGTYDYECTRHTGMTGRVTVQATEPATYSSLSVTPSTPSLAVADTGRLVATPRDQYGTPMSGLPAPTFTSNAPGIASVSASGLVTGVAPGTTTIIASLTASGATHAATATVTVMSPQAGGATATTPNRTFSPQSLTITVGTTVTWQIQETTHNVTFIGAAPPGGNIPDTPAGNAVSRTFTAAGTYDYECTRHAGMAGRIVVQAPGGESPVFTTLELTPASASVVVGGAVQLTATALDQYGSPMSGLPAPTFTSSAPGIASVSVSGLVAGVAPGPTTIIVSLTANGATHADTSVVTVTTAPSGPTVTTPGNTFGPQEVQIAPGGMVTWAFSETTHNVTFRDLAPPGGNIPDTAPGNSVSRTFPTAGDYDYVCTRHDGMKGRVRVR